MASNYTGLREWSWLIHKTLSLHYALQPVPVDLGNRIDAWCQWKVHCSTDGVPDQFRRWAWPLRSASLSRTISLRRQPAVGRRCQGESLRSESKCRLAPDWKAVQTAHTGAKPVGGTRKTAAYESK